MLERLWPGAGTRGLRAEKTKQPKLRILRMARMGREVFRKIQDLASIFPFAIFVSFVVPAVPSFCPRLSVPSVKSVVGLGPKTRKRPFNYESREWREWGGESSGKSKTWLPFPIRDIRFIRSAAVPSFCPRLSVPSVKSVVGLDR